MKLYVKDLDTGEKVYLQQTAKDREQLVKVLGTEKFKVQNKIYYVKNVQAEIDSKTAPAMALGGVIGVLGGVPGVLIGGLIGGLLGNNSDEEDKLKVANFNRSRYVQKN